MNSRNSPLVIGTPPPCTNTTSILPYFVERPPSEAYLKPLSACNCTSDAHQTHIPRHILQFLTPREVRTLSISTILSLLCPPMNLTSHRCPTTSLLISRFCSNNYGPLYTPGTLSKRLLIPHLMQESCVSPSAVLINLCLRPSDSFIWNSPSIMFLLFSLTSTASTSSPALS